MSEEEKQHTSETEVVESKADDKAEDNAVDENSAEYLRTHWSQLPQAQTHDAFFRLSRTDAEELFLSLTAQDQYPLIKECTTLEKRSWIRLLAPDDVADLIQEEEDVEHREDWLSLLDPQTKREVGVLLAYAEDNAGGIMSSRFIRLRPKMNVDEAISYIRLQAKTQVETIYYAYVLTTDQKLLGVVSFRELFASAPTKKVDEIMHSDIIRVPVDMDQEQIGQIFSQNNLMALPVVDADDKMVGIVTFDDVAEAVQEEATEDIHKIAGMESLDAPYLQIAFSDMLKKRAGWLVVLLVGEMFTATALGYYEDEMKRAVVLSMFLPLIISSGGNTGSQASTLVIRAMALGEVRLKDWWRVLIREISTGLCLGLILGGIALLRVYLWPWAEQMYGEHYRHVAYTVAASIIGVVLWGTISGSMLPFILRKFKLDPASASAPAVATIVDVTGLIIYFSFASLILKGILL
ncbi:MAG: magnesium transporter [Pseudobdellovibrio sp.]|nr:magnesium transporter [Pseudobdellovibrio sp.]